FSQRSGLSRCGVCRLCVKPCLPGMLSRKSAKLRKDAKRLLDSSERRGVQQREQLIARAIDRIRLLRLDGDLHPIVLASKCRIRTDLDLGMIGGDRVQTRRDVELILASVDHANVKRLSAKAFSNRFELLAKQLGDTRKYIDILRSQHRPTHGFILYQLRTFRRIRHSQSGRVDAVSEVASQHRFEL